MTTHPQPFTSRLGRAVPLMAALSLVLAGCDAGITDPAADGPRIVTRSLPSAMVLQSYSGDVRAQGGAGGYVWRILDGNLPPGLEVSLADLSGTEALIAGTPQDAGRYTFFLVVEDNGGLADTAQLSIEVIPGPGAPEIVSRRLAPALAGASYGVELQATGGAGGDYEWSAVGALPTGLELTSAGRFSGSPTTPGRHDIRVQVASGGATTQTTFTLDVVEGRTGYAITAFNVVDLAPSLQDNVAAAIARWEAALVGDLPTITVPVGEAGLGPDACGGFGAMVNGTSLDDVIMLVAIDSIDGVGGIMGRAGPCAVREGSLIPAVGYLALDEADLRDLAARSEELVTDLIQHEIGHILGFGTLWPYLDLVSGADGPDPRYTGAHGVAAYQAAGGAGAAIPVESEGGEGTAGKHWRESTFDKLLMTGFSEPAGVDMPLSRMTVASFADLGYEVDLDAADAGADVLAGLALDGGGSQGHGAAHDPAGAGPIRVLGGVEGHPVFLEPRTPGS